MILFVKFSEIGKISWVRQQIQGLVGVVQKSGLHTWHVWDEALSLISSTACPYPTPVSTTGLEQYQTYRPKCQACTAGPESLGVSSKLLITAGEAPKIIKRLGRGLGPHLVMLKPYSCLCTQRSLLTELVGAYVILGVELGLVTCMICVLHAPLFL